MTSSPKTPKSPSRKRSADSTSRKGTSAAQSKSLGPKRAVQSRATRKSIQSRATAGTRSIQPDPAGSPRSHEPSTATAEGVRLQKVLAAAGIASRRVAEDLITQGRVSVDGRVVTRLGTRVQPESARVEVDGQRIGVRPNREYLLMNKPAGYISTAKDPLGRRTVFDLIKSKRRLFTVGRLDNDTTGLLLLTDDGELAHRLTHPRYAIERIYVAKVAGSVTEAAVRKLKSGVRLEDGVARAVRARVRAAGKTNSQVEIVMTEGRKREVRRMFEAVGHPVGELARVGFGHLRLGRLAPGQTRTLTANEVGELYKLVGL